MAEDNVHKGHRERLRRQVAQNGLDVLNDHTVLELLLFYTIPRHNTNEYAHELINKFGSFSKVFETPREELSTVDGIGESSAFLLSLIPQIARRYICAKLSDDGKHSFSTLREIGNYVAATLMFECDEINLVLCLDNKRHVINKIEISRGSADCVRVNMKVLIRSVCDCHAVSVVIAHNHPNGIAAPSVADMDAIETISEALKTIDVPICANVISTGTEFIVWPGSPSLCGSDYQFPRYPITMDPQCAGDDSSPPLCISRRRTR